MIKFLLKLCGYAYVRIYLKSGNNFLIICKKFTYTRYEDTTQFSSYHIEGIYRGSPAFVVSQMEAVTTE